MQTDRDVGTGGIAVGVGFVCRLQIVAVDVIP
jgi:hypothetical protein